MKRTIKDILSRRGRLSVATMIAAAAGLAVSAPALSQSGTQWGNDESYEWEAGEGLHEEEWYDPSDWFNDDESPGVDYEYDYWGYNNPDDYDYYNRYDYVRDDSWYTDRDDDSWGNQESYEWSPGEGYHEEEWYDPSDWLNDDNRTSYESDNWGYDTYDNNYLAGYNNRYNYRYDYDYYTDENDPLDYDYWDSQYDYDYQSRATNQDRNRSMRDVQLSGQLESWQRKSLKGQRDAHTLVRLKTQDGRSAIVNLGPNVELSRLDLDRGDRIAVRGDRGTIDGRNVVLAQRIRVGDKTVRMNNWNPDRRDQQRSTRQRDQMARDRMNQDRYADYSGADRSPMPRSDRQAQLQGRLDGWQKISLNGEKDDHTLVRLQLRDGTSKVVNLGPNVEVSRLNLDRGDTIAVQGIRGSLDGRDVLMAQRVKVGDKVVRMNNWEPKPKRDADRNRGWNDAGKDNRGTDNRGTDARSWDDSQQRERTAIRDRRDNRSSGYSSSESDRQRRDMQREAVDRIVSDWPAESRKAAQRMIEVYGEPDAASKLRLTWLNKGPFVKTVVHKQPVQHNFPAPHKDVLEQFVNYKVPADKMDELAKFDGSIVVFRTDGLMSARCHKEDMNILALNLAHEVIQGDRTWQEARDKFTQVASSYKDGDRPEITQRLAFDSSSRNSSDHDYSDGERQAQR